MMMRSRILLILGILLVIAGIALLYQPEREVPEMVIEEEPVQGEFFETESYSFRYPTELSTQYIHPMEWPPRLTVTEGSHTCDTETKEVEGRTYCVSTQSEGAAGSIYTDYAYRAEKGNSTLTLSFTLRMTQCGNYDEAERIACEQERSSFSPGELADQILQTVELK